MTTPPNYPFFYPESDDSMADVKKNLTDNFQLIAPRGDPTVIAAGAALPQVGDYEIGDRVFRADPADTVNGNWPSSYILICKDAEYGWHWRPVQTMLSPWVTIPATAIGNVEFQMHPTAPLQMAFDSKGFCFWRGSIQKIVPSFVSNSSYTNILKVMPIELRPNTDYFHTVALTPVVSAAGKPGNVSGRITLNKTGAVSFRFANATNPTSQNIWLDGLNYNNATSYYLGP